MSTSPDPRAPTDHAAAQGARSPSESGHAKAGLTRWAPLLVIALAWLAHESVRHAGWVLDDVRLVRDNPEVTRGPSAIPRMFARGSAPEHLESGNHGPLARASFALEAPLWRGKGGALSPTGFHLTNLLLHGLCALLLLAALRSLFPGRTALALGGAICFAVHPIHTGTVSSLMGRADLLATLFSLLTLLAWRRFDRAQPAWLPLAAVCWLLALLSREVALGVPLVLFALEIAVPRPEGRRIPRWALAVFLVPLAVFWVAWPGMPPPAIDLPVQGVGERLLVGLEGVGRMALLVAVPIGLRADYSDEALPGIGFLVQGAGWVALALVLLLAAIAVGRVLRGRAGVPSGAWLTTLLLSVPAVLALPIGASLEPRFAYLCALPLFAVAGLLAEALARVGQAATSSFAHARAMLVGATAVICLVGLTQRAAQAWRDDETLHTHMLEENPRHVRAMVRIARSHRRTANQLRAAASQLPARNPERQRLLEQRREALERGVAWGTRAVSHERGRQSADALREMGLLYLAQDSSAHALRALERAQALDPVLQRPPAEVLQLYPPERLRAAAELYFAIGRAREALGNRSLAADAYVAASLLDEDRNDYRAQAGLSLCRVNRYGEGLTLLHEALRRTRDHERRTELEAILENQRESALRIAESKMAEGQTEQEQGRNSRAATLYEEALEINPALTEAWVRAGWLRGYYFGNYVMANEYFERAEKLMDERRLPADHRLRRRVSGYRELLREQEAEEDAEERRLLEEERKAMEAEKRRRRGGGGK